MQLDALNKRAQQAQQKLQPVDTDRAEVRAMLAYISDLELAQMAAVYETAARRMGVAAIDLLSPDTMTTAEVTLFEDIEQNALARKAAGQAPYSVLQR